jgi:hypothetical protein
VTRACDLTPIQPRSLRVLIVARTLLGTALVIAPGAVLSGVPHERIDGPARAFARVLGARHLIQAAITARRHDRTWILAGAAVDAAHAATMAVVAGLRPDWRQVTLTSAATATALSAAGIAESYRQHAPGRVDPGARGGEYGAGR